MTPPQEVERPPLSADIPATWYVLIVDSGPDNRAVAVDAFRMVGAHVHEAEDDLHALSRLKDQPVNVVVTELETGTLSGFDLLAAIRTDPACKGLPVLALTSHAMASHQQRVEEAGFDGYISKPYRLDTLIDCMKAILKTATGTTS